MSSAAAAVADIRDGESVMIGGFGTAGMPDELIDAGGCIAQTDSVRIDARLGSQLEKILNDLLG